jgi:hypothetical protein
LRKKLACIVAVILIFICVQSTLAESPCSIYVNNGGASNAFVEVYQGSQRVAYGNTDNRGIYTAYLNKGQGYTVRVNWNGRSSTTDVTATDPIYVFV